MMCTPSLVSKSDGLGLGKQNGPMPMSVLFALTDIVHCFLWFCMVVFTH